IQEGSMSYQHFFKVMSLPQPPSFQQYNYLCINCCPAIVDHLKNALIKQLYLFLMTKENSWKTKAFKWNDIQRELIDQFGERYEKYT
ncbi:MAG: hypothetical protein PHE56_05700, partial [Bacteroidales bacterium]|nr:hypothetical protein [Bacteroidales bacterium]